VRNELKKPASCRLIYCRLLTAAAIWFLLRPEDAFSSREPVPTSLENAMARNNRLMVFTRHWKLIPVLPMFRA
jgi:hypothetical protein